MNFWGLYKQVSYNVADWFGAWLNTAFQILYTLTSVGITIGRHLPLVAGPLIGALGAAAIYLMNMGAKLVEGFVEADNAQSLLGSWGEQAPVIFDHIERGIPFLNCFVPLDMVFDSIMTISLMWVVCTTIRVIKSWLPTMG